MKKRTRQKGFTLIEFLIAGSLFVTILLIVTSIAVRSLKVHSRLVAVEEVNDEIRYVIDTISRAVRVSKIESGGASLILSAHPTKGNVIYSLSGGVLQENGEDVTSSNITIDILTFTVSGIGFEGFGIGAQPKVTLTIKAKSANPVFASESEVLVQTTVEQKELDVSPLVFLETIDFTAEGDYIEENSLVGTEISGVGKLQGASSWGSQQLSSIGGGSKYAQEVIFDDVNSKYVVGGYDTLGNAYVWIYDIAAGLWTRHDVGAREVNAVIFDRDNNKYIAGGTDGLSRVAAWEYDIPSGIWTPTVIETKGYIESLLYDSVNNKYIAGGGKSGLLATTAYVWEYDIAAGTWSNSIVDAAGGNLKYIENIIYDPGRNKYVAGGSDGWDAAVWEGDAATGVWSRKLTRIGTIGIFRLYGLEHDTVNNKYICGGRDQVQNAVIWTYDIAGDSWSEKVIDNGGNLQVVYSIEYDAVQNKYMAGGFDRVSGNEAATIWEYDVAGEVWTKIPVESGAGNYSIKSVLYDTVNNVYMASGYAGADAVLWTNAVFSGYPTAQPYYITTDNPSQIDVSSWTAIDNVIINQVEPANTSLKYLVSFDGRLTWNYWNGASWILSSLANLQTEGMTKAEVEAITKLEWGGAGGFAAGTTLTLDFAVDLSSTDSAKTPEVDVISINYES